MARSTLDRLYSLRAVNTLSLQDRIDMSRSQQVERGVADQRTTVRDTATVVLMNGNDAAGSSAESDE